MSLGVHPDLAISAPGGLNRLGSGALCFFTAGAAMGVAAELEAPAGVGVAAAIALVFLECFFAGEAEASGVGLGVGSAARTTGAATKAVMITIRIVRERISSFLRLDSWIWQDYRFGRIKFVGVANVGR